MAQLDFTSFAAGLKTLYSKDKIHNMTYQDNPFFAMIKKDENFYGDSKKIPVIYADTQNRAASFSTAVNSSVASKQVAFFITRVSDYSIALIKNELIEASQNDAGAFMEAATHEIDSAIHSLTRSLAISMYGSGSGSIGRVGATTVLGSTLLVLADPESVTNFEVGQVLRLSGTDGGGSLRANSVSVVGVDRDLGQLTLSANVSTITGAALADYIIQDGDYDLKIKGLRAWIPDVAPGGSDNFFGVNRSVDVTRLAGLRDDFSALPIEEAVVKASTRLAREGAKPDVAFISYKKWADLENALGSKVQYIDVEVAKVGFRGIIVQGPRGPIKVIGDQNCPSDRMFMLQMDTWKLQSLGQAPKLIETDGLKMLRSAGEDGVQVRCTYYAQMSCGAPGYNGNFKI
jgi:hypothetical protein